MRAISTAFRVDPLRVTVLADSLGEPTADPKGIGLDGILGWLCNQEEKTILTWDLDPQVNGWLSALPKPERIAIFSGEEEVRYAEYAAPGARSWAAPYRLTYVPGKFLRIAKARQRWTVCDVSGYWPSGTPIEDALVEWGLPASELAAAPERKEWKGWADAAIVGHCRARAGQIAALMGVVLPALTDAGLRHRLPIGVGSIASALMTEQRDDHWLARYFPDRQPIVGGVPLLPLFFAAYYGGRIEATVVGQWDTPGWDYDMRAAYAWALSHLGPVGFVWNEATTFSHAYEDRMSVWYVSWDVGTLPLGPLPYRGREGGVTTYPQTGRGWYWWPEIHQALLAYGPDQIRVERGYISPFSLECPLADTMLDRYDQRERLSREGSPVAGVLKRSMAAMYGKLCQSVSKGGLPGARYNIALAGWVTSAVRSRLIQAWAGREWAVCTISTDGLLTTMELPNATLGERMGDWRVEDVDAATVVLPGVYRLRVNGTDGSPAKDITAMAGLPRGTDFDWLLGRLRGLRAARVPIRVFQPNILIDAFDDAPEWERCRWRPSHTTVDPYRMAHKREVTSDLLTLRWGETDQFLAFRPYKSRGDGDSAPHPYPPAWQAEAPSLTALALAHYRSPP